MGTTAEDDVELESSGDNGNLCVNSVLDEMQKELDAFSLMKMEFSSQNLQELPCNIGDSIKILTPFHKELQLKWTKMKQEFLKHKDKCLVENKGQYYFIYGKFLNILEDHNSDALPYFEKAAKFIPHLTEVWNELGDCYLAMNNLEMAKSCFQEALRREKNTWSYRGLSVLCRKKVPNDGCGDTKAAVEMGVLYAKEAIKIDPADSYSWMILGNAYMAYFLVAKDEVNVPVKALQAYAQAEKNNGHFPELFFNKAIALLYSEDYSKCLEALEEAIRRDPIWTLAWEKYFSVKDYIQKVSDFCFTKGKLRVKRITQMVHSLTRESTVSLCTKYSYINVNTLSEGINFGKVILGKVLWSCEIDDSFPFTFGIVDGMCNLVVITLYNLKTGIGVKIGDTVAIPNPNYSTHHCTFGGKVYVFQRIRVDFPKDITINGRLLPDSHCGQALTISKCE